MWFAVSIWPAKTFCSPRCRRMALRLSASSLTTFATAVRGDGAVRPARSVNQYATPAQTSIEDYSGKEKDTWGQYQLIERGYSNKASISTIILNNNATPSARCLRRAGQNPPCARV